jgi:hypothetical protein
MEFAKKGENMKTIDKETSLRLFEDFKKEYKFKLINKKDSCFMKFIAWFLNLFGIMNKEMFMNNYTTTIGKKIYHSFEIGEGSEDELWGQIKTLIHEVIHTHQFEKEGFFTYSWRYLANRSKRAMYEAEAYRSGMVLDFLKFKMVEEPLSIAEKLYNYDLKEEHVKAVAIYLQESIEKIKKGEPFHPITEHALEWLKG